MKCFAVSAALFLGCVPSFAAYTVQLTETGGNVVAVGNGTLNTTALAAPTPSGYNAFLISLNAVVIVGPESGTAVENRAGISGPISAGTSAALVIADTGSGDKVGVQGGSGALVTDSGYVSGTPLSSTSTWNGATFASLGLTPGRYVWTWGSGGTADSFTLLIGLVQTITFTSIAPAGAILGDAPYVIAATGGGSGNAVVFTIDAAAAGVCSIVGATVSFTGVGTCVVNANQAGGSGYAPALQAQQSFNVAAAPMAAPTSIPTLSEWALVLTSFIVAMLGIAQVRRATTDE